MGVAPFVLICFFANVVFCYGYRPRLANIVYHNFTHFAIYFEKFLLAFQMMRHLTVICCIFLANRTLPSASQSRRRRVYHQCVALYITNTKCCISSSRRQNARWRVMRYSPKGADDIHDCVVMICQACRLG